MVKFIRASKPLSVYVRLLHVCTCARVCVCAHVGNSFTAGHTRLETVDWLMMSWEDGAGLVSGLSCPSLDVS